MALKLPTNRNENVKVICRLDGAIQNQDGYEAYLESFAEKDGPHEDHLRLRPGDEPTRFVMRRTLPFAMKQMIRGKNMSIQGSDVVMNVNYMADMIRAALIHVENPGDDGLKLKRGRDGLVDGDYVSRLEDAGVLGDLSKAYMNAIGADEKAETDAKNS